MPRQLACHKSTQPGACLWTELGAIPAVVPLGGDGDSIALVTEPPDSDDELAEERVLSVGSRVPSHYRECFGCGQQQVAGLRMKMIVVGPQEVEGRFRVRVEHQGAPGLIHGGVLSAGFDEVLGGVNWLLSAPAVTARLETDFRRPVPVDSEVVIRAHVDRVDGRKVYVQASALIEGQDEEVAAARGLFIRVPPEHFAEHGRAEDVAAVIARGSKPWLD